ncbi:MAG: aryl-sulfate sulfotransferase [Crocinitomicaceae bacterium]|nr:aryl-sulfate sulfotransferase [Crocinitomicaceae bacterium]
MKLLKYLFLFIIFHTTLANGQGRLFPAANDTLTFSDVLFEFPYDSRFNNYVIEVEDLSKNKGHFRYETKANKVRVSTLLYNTDYRWRFSPINDANKPIVWSDFIPFRVRIPNNINPDHYSYDGAWRSREDKRVSILLMDYGMCGVNRAGKVLYYIPEIEGVLSAGQMRDLKLTNNGTFTALIDSSAYEFDLLGRVLFKAPDNGDVNGESSEYYHHEFTKLPNGNYLVLGNDHVTVQAPDQSSMEIEFATVIEYDSRGRVVWSWNSKDYFSQADLFYPRGAKRGGSVSLHANACTTNGKYVFVGFRDISRIITIDKKSKKVVASYGGKGVFNEPHSATGFFRRQHDATLLSDGNLAVVNNDSVMDPDVVSSLVVFSPIKKRKDVSEKIMDFKFNFDTLTDGKSVKTGNLQELSNGNIFVNMGSLNRCIELTRTGDVIYSMFMTYYDTNHRMTLPFPQYRVRTYSSLYQFEYTAKISSINQNKEFRNYTLSLFNVGSEDDTYFVRMYDESKKILAEEKIMIPAGKSDFKTFETDKNTSVYFEIANTTQKILKISN